MSPHRILIADDDKAIADGIGEILKASGYEVTKVHDGEEALAAFQKEPFDVVITDNVMPKKTGMQLIQEIRRVDSTCTIILMTATPQDQDFFAAYTTLNVTRYLAKPFEIAQLRAVVKSCVEAKEIVENLEQLRENMKSSLEDMQKNREAKDPPR